MQKYQIKPEWLKISIPSGERYSRIREIVEEKNLHTVCKESRCPNVAECWSGGTATFMLMGGICTRGCKFCHITTGRPLTLDPLEPENIVYACREMDLEYVVLTSVDRDDLADGGARHLAKTIALLRKEIPKIIVEILIPDFQGNTHALDEILLARPQVIAHNVETVERLQKKVRDPRANYHQSLGVLAYLKRKAPQIYTKTSIMLGVGEKPEEIMSTFWDLRKIQVDIVTLGQYLQPSAKHLAVTEFIHPDQFAEYQRWGEKVGFAFVASGPLVRSSYRAGEYFIKNLIQKETQSINAEDA
jgi:lipoic acid synthetase